MAALAPGHVNLQTLAGLLKLTDRRVQQLADEGVLPKGDRGSYPWVQCVHAYIEYLRNSPSQHRGNDQQRLVRAQAQKIELQNQIASGSAVLATDVAATMNQIAAVLSSNLDATAGRLATRVAAESNPAVCRQMILDEHREVRIALADACNQRADTLDALTDGSADPATAEAEEPESVG